MECWFQWYQSYVYDSFVESFESTPHNIPAVIHFKQQQQQRKYQEIQIKYQSNGEYFFISLDIFLILSLNSFNIYFHFSSIKCFFLFRFFTNFHLFFNIFYLWIFSNPYLFIFLRLNYTLIHTRRIETTLNTTMNKMHMWLSKKLNSGFANVAVKVKNKIAMSLALYHHHTAYGDTVRVC